MEKGATRWAFLRWRGLLDNARIVARRTVAFVLTFACITMAFTQWGFIGVQFVEGDKAYLVAMVIPVALAVLLLGLLPGLLIGVFSGIVLCLHARIMPLDYYELTYVTPASALVGMALFSLILGLLFPFILGGRFSGWRRSLLVVAACFLASAAFSARFQIGVIIANFAEAVSVSGLGLGAGQFADMQAQASAALQSSSHVGFQILGDTILAGGACLAGLAIFGWRTRRYGEEGLREVFGSHLFVMVLLVFMIVITGAYAAVTAAELRSSTGAMRSEVNYLLAQMRGSEDAKTAKEILEGYTEDEDGLILIATKGHLVAADTSREDELLGWTLVEAFEEEGWEYAQRSAASGMLERVIYGAPSSYDNLVDVMLPGQEEQFESLITWQVGYLAAGIEGETVVVLIRPARMVFEGRSDVVLWVTLSMLALLAMVFVLTSRLLDRLVASRIDETNTVLRRITDGDLDARVVPEGTKEFWDLSAGINVTVDALQGWIAEAESRMDSELAAAKAIQESALPSVFPPFPDITRFDVYASMNAAREVGGDFYDFFLVGDDCGPDGGRLAFVIADVSGKGVPASLFMMKAKALIRGHIERGVDLGAAMEAVNLGLCDGNDEGMFVTVWAGVLDYATGHVEYVNAGHNPPMLRQRGSWSWMRESSGMALGLFDDEPYETLSFDCEPGDLILLYTDGVTESFSVEHEQYGEERLERLACEHVELGPRELIDCVSAGVAQHAEGAEQSDDITMLALEFRG